MLVSASSNLLPLSKVRTGRAPQGRGEQAAYSAGKPDILVGALLLIGLGIHEAVQLGWVGHLDLHDPATVGV